MCWSGFWPPSGSSPRVWGILNLNAAGLCVTRFIPTRVGNTAHEPEEGYFVGVHPHACGEYGGFHHLPRLGRGSSPRVWGIQNRRRGLLFGGRFIPTRVGNTVYPGACTTWCPVHPHACGEYFYPPLRSPPGYGSSPRVWGIRPCYH